MATLREASRLQTRRRVLDAAAELFERRGFAATTIRAIAEAGGVSVGSVMAVGDKDALLVQIFDDLVARGQDSATPPDATDDPDTVARLLDLVRPFVTIFTAHPDLARTYASILVSGRHDSRLLDELAGLLIARMTVTIDPMTDPATASSNAIARAAYLAYVGTLFSHAATGSDDPAVLTAELRTTFAVICGPRGIA